MQYVIQQVTQDLRLTGIETEIIAIVDRRTPAEQVETPMFLEKSSILKDREG